MSINELEAKCRELRQLQALIEEAQAEAEAIKDALKAAMGDAEAVQAGEYKITWKAVKTARIDTTALKRPCPTWRSGSRRRPPPGASAWHDKGPLCERRPKQHTRGPEPTTRAVGDSIPPARRNGKAKQAYRPGGKKMRTIEITYEIKTANGNWIRRVYATNDGNDYERVVNILHQNKDEYRVIKVRHI